MANDCSSSSVAQKLKCFEEGRPGMKREALNSTISVDTMVTAAEAVKALVHNKWRGLEAVRASIMEPENIADVNHIQNRISIVGSVCPLIEAQIITRRRDPETQNRPSTLPADMGLVDICALLKQYCYQLRMSPVQIEDVAECLDYALKHYRMAESVYLHGYFLGDKDFQYTFQLLWEAFTKFQDALKLGGGHNPTNNSKRCLKAIEMLLVNARHVSIDSKWMQLDDTHPYNIYEECERYVQKECPHRFIPIRENAFIDCPVLHKVRSLPPPPRDWYIDGAFLQDIETKLLPLVNQEAKLCLQLTLAKNHMELAKVFVQHNLLDKASHTVDSVVAHLTGMDSLTLIRYFDHLLARRNALLQEAKVMMSRIMVGTAVKQAEERVRQSQGPRSGEDLEKTLELAWEDVDRLFMAIQSHRQEIPRLSYGFSFDFSDETNALMVLASVYKEVLRMDMVAGHYESQATCMSENSQRCNVSTCRACGDRLRQCQWCEDNEERQRSAERQPVMNDVVCMWRQADTLTHPLFLRTLYQQHPPRNPSRNTPTQIVDTPTESQLKRLFQRAIIDYHPDRVSVEQHGQQWKTLNVEIFRKLSHMYGGAYKEVIADRFAPFL